MRRIWLVLPAALGLSCGSPTTPGPTTPASTGSAFNASQYLGAMIDIMQANSYYRQNVDWATFRNTVVQQGAGATAVTATYPAIETALQLLGQAGDGHSHYIGANGVVVQNPLFPTGCSAPPWTVPTVPSDIGYVHVPTFSSSNSSAIAAFIASLQTSIRNADRPDLAGWIVDLRGNGGGSFWYMLAGVEPVLGDGTYGAFVRPDESLSVRCSTSAAGGQCFEGSGSTVTFANPYQLTQTNARVALLTDSITVSAGELVLVCFLHRPNTMVFGTHTCGLPTGVGSFTLSDGATLDLEQSLSADRSGQLHNGPIVPDEVVIDPNQVLQDAIAWLRGQ